MVPEYRADCTPGSDGMYLTCGPPSRTGGVHDRCALLRHLQPILGSYFCADPKGYASWSLRLLARRVVELAIVGSVNHETIRRTLKKTG